MHYISHYQPPLGDILLAVDEIGLTGLCLRGRNILPFIWTKNIRKRNCLYLNRQKKWLDIYFSGKEPDFEVPLHFTGTEFQNEVWSILYSIPYGQTTTYGEIAKRLAARRGLSRMSAQAVGGAVGHNEISIIVP